MAKYPSGDSGGCGFLVIVGTPFICILLYQFPILWLIPIGMACFLYSKFKDS